MMGARGGGSPDAGKGKDPRGRARELPQEVPVAVTVNGSTLAVMMATPADLSDFALGFALTEGAIASPAEVESLEILTHRDGIEARLWIAGEGANRLAARRRRIAGPVGCGLCGVESLDAAVRALPRVAAPLTLTRHEIATAPEALKAHQPLHDRTRAAHAAGFLRPGAGIVHAREDIGRHNALDKLIGALVAAGEAPGGGAAVLTSRVSVEMVEKAAMAGLPAIIAASAPTTLALAQAEKAGLTLAAFVRDGRFELYSHPERVQTGETDAA